MKPGDDIRRIRVDRVACTWNVAVDVVGQARWFLLMLVPIRLPIFESLPPASVGRRGPLASFRAHMSAGPLLGRDTAGIACTPMTLRQDIVGLADAEWTNWPHAYSKATDTRGHLAALLDDDADAQNAAALHFRSAIVHQSTLWPASPDAFDWLIRVLRAHQVPEPALTGCLTALTEAGEQLSDIPADTPVPALSPEARTWLDRFANAPEETENDEDEDDDEDTYESLWAEFLESNESDEIYQWTLARTAALRPAVAALVQEIDGQAPEQVAAVREAWKS
ncbi:hypothetical protein JOF56_008947 [Kibdelosporangium banguiense]|uniref:Uncharacterized protein n=1 Tax=Kibdelosporangium banguiense TaxID=1365924 RepID=A0ABS4TVY8_9PSEU|nr:hypothetical protein [Kibdelosporangium banguiense]MBP2328562.1 hypothetical protein [Kibdelosporangium banguiense]